MRKRNAVSVTMLLLLACGAGAVESKRSVPLGDPVLEMKSAGGDAGMQNVVGLGVGRDGAVIVGDAAAAQVVRVSVDGNTVSREGRRGSLAGEYQRLQWVGFCDDSVLLVHDIALARLSTLGDDMKPVANRSVPKAFDSRDVNGCLAGSRVLVLNDSSRAVAYGMYRRPMTLVGFNWRTGKADSIRQFRGNEINYMRQFGTSILVPMGARTLVSTVGANIVVAESDLDSLWRYDGSTWRSVRLKDVPAARAPSAMDDQRARLLLGWAPVTVQDRAFAPELLAATPTAKLGPRIEGLVASDDGTAWVGLRADAKGVREWVGYNERGEPKAATHFHWTFEPRVVRGATWWGIERDSIGVESVVRYRVNGTP
ncbi:MAG: hypothetical protein ACO1Q7_15945 [Gemmatimonas sp.]